MPRDEGLPVYWNNVKEDCMIGKGRPVDKSPWRQGQIPEFDFGWNTQLLIRFQQSSDLKVDSRFRSKGEERGLWSRQEQERGTAEPSGGGLGPVRRGA